MHYTELLKANNIEFRMKFINLLRQETALDLSGLSQAYDILLDSKKVMIKFKSCDTEILNNIIRGLMELEINIGDTSFHEENADID